MGQVWWCMEQFPIWASGKASSNCATSIYRSICLLYKSLLVTALLRTDYAQRTKPGCVWEYSTDLAQESTLLSHCLKVRVSLPVVVWTYCSCCENFQTKLVSKNISFKFSFRSACVSEATVTVGLTTSSNLYFPSLSTHTSRVSVPAGWGSRLLNSC